MLTLCFEALATFASQLVAAEVDGQVEVSGGGGSRRGAGGVGAGAGRRAPAQGAVSRHREGRPWAAGGR